MPCSHLCGHTSHGPSKVSSERTDSCAPGSVGASMTSMPAREKVGVHAGKLLVSLGTILCGSSYWSAACLSLWRLLFGVAVWQEKGDLGKAIDDYSEAIRVDRLYFDAYFRRATACHGNGEYQNAIRDYSQTIGLAPKRGILYCSRGISKHCLGDWDGAIGDYGKAIKFKFTDLTVYVNRGLAWHCKDEFDKAIADYDRVVKLDAENVTALINRGIAWWKRGDYAQAIRDYHEVIKIDSQYALAYNNLAWLWATCPDATCRDAAKALEFALKACDLTKYETTNCLSTLAAYAENGDFDRAVHWEQKAAPGYAAEEAEKYGHLLALYQQRKSFRDDQ